MEVDLDSTTQGTFFIPCKKRRREEAELPPEEAAVPEPSAWTQAAFDKSWAKHQARIADTLKRLTKWSSEQLVGWESESYAAGEPRKPYASIPTALVSSTSVQTLHSLVATVEQLLEAKRKAVKGKGKEPAGRSDSTIGDVEMADDLAAPSEPESRRTVIECKTGTSLETLVESIVLGLLGDDSATGSTPTLPSLLRFQETQTRLSITLHQIHLLPLRTLTALLTVLTRYSPRLRLVLILTTASAPGILGEVVPAAIMEALEMRVFDGVEGGDVWEEVVKDLYFSNWEPEVLIDGATFDELRDTYERSSHSVEGLISALHYIHMRAFFGPLGQFIPRPPPASTGSAGTSAPPDLYTEAEQQKIFKRLLVLPSVLQSSLARSNPALQPPLALLLESTELGGAHAHIPPAAFPRDLVAASHKLVHKHAADRRLAFAIFASVRNYLAGRRDDGGAAGGSTGVMRVRALEGVRLMRSVVNGEASGTDRGYVWTTKLVAKLSVSELPRLMDNIKAGIQPFGMFRISAIFSELNKVKESPSQTAAALEGFFSKWITRHERVLFHELYYFRDLRDLIKVFRPAPLEALQTALLSPQTYLGKSSCDPTNVTTMPDTTLLFMRYLESGKMINLYDWFEAFSSTLQVPPPTDADNEAQIERRREVQARFMRGFHQLDYLGLLKGTKRKPDHVLKTVFMVGEDDGEAFLEGQRAGAQASADA